MVAQKTGQNGSGIRGFRADHVFCDAQRARLIVGNPVLLAPEEDVSAGFALHAAEKPSALRKEREKAVVFRDVPHQRRTGALPAERHDALQIVQRHAAKLLSLDADDHILSVQREIRVRRRDIQGVQ